MQPGEATDSSLIEDATEISGKQEHAAGHGSLWYLFVPRQDYFITPVIIYINLLIFILMLFNGVNIFAPDKESLISWGANYRPVTTQGEWWRLLTSCFLHIGIIHIAMNMLALAYIGLLLEPHLGKMRFLSAYLLTGIAASATSLWWHPQTISAGASGAIFGMYGLFLAMLTTSLIERTARKALLTSIAVFIVYNLLSGVKGSVDNAAHSGGLVSGILTGYLFVPSLKKGWNEDLKLFTIGAAAIIIIAASAFFYNHSKNDLPAYEAKMKKFDTMQSLALEIYHLPEGTPKETLLSEIKDKGLYYWDEITTLLNDADQLDLPEAYHRRNKKLQQYCDLRIKTYNMLYLFVQTGDNRFRDSANYYDRKISLLTKELQKPF